MPLSRGSTPILPEIESQAPLMSYKDALAFDFGGDSSLDSEPERYVVANAVREPTSTEVPRAIPIVDDEVVQEPLSRTPPADRFSSLPPSRQASIAKPADTPPPPARTGPPGVPQEVPIVAVEAVKNPSPADAPQVAPMVGVEAFENPSPKDVPQAVPIVGVEVLVNSSSADTPSAVPTVGDESSGFVVVQEPPLILETKRAASSSSNSSQSTQRPTETAPNSPKSETSTRPTEDTPRAVFLQQAPSPPSIPPVESKATISLTTEVPAGCGLLFMPIEPSGGQEVLKKAQTAIGHEPAVPMHRISPPRSILKVKTDETSLKVLGEAASQSSQTSQPSQPSQTSRKSKRSRVRDLWRRLITKIMRKCLKS